jgi:hypothetical protein
MHQTAGRESPIDRPLGGLVTRLIKVVGCRVADTWLT